MKAPAISTSKRLILKLLADRPGLSTAQLSAALNHQSTNTVREHCLELQAQKLIRGERSTQRAPGKRNGPAPTLWHLAAQASHDGADSGAAAQ